MLGRRVAVGTVLAGWLAMAGGSEALAQQEHAPQGTAVTSGADAQLERARQLYKDGVKEASRGNWEKARALLTEALNLRPHFQIAFSLGEAELKLGDHLAAAEHLAFFLRQAKDVGERERRKVEGMLDEVKRNVATLVILTNQQGAEVRVDGVLKGNTPLGKVVFVAPGRHVLQAHHEGFVPGIAVRTVTAGAQLVLELTLVKMAATVATAAPAAAETKPMPDPEASAEGRPRMGVIVAGAVAGTAAAAAGAGFLIASKSETATDHDGLVTASVISFVAAGAIGAGTLIYALSASEGKGSAIPTNTSAKFIVAPVAGPGGAGVWATVRW